MIAADEFRRAIGRFATGVAIVTTERDRELHGMTVNAVSSVSLDPCLLLVCLARRSRTAAAVGARGRFNLHVLSRRGEVLCRRFASAGEDHYLDVPYRLDEHGLPVLPYSLCHFACAVHELVVGGDHLVVFGLVEECVAHPPGDVEPLVFWESAFRRLAPAEDVRPFPLWDEAEWEAHAALGW